MYKYKVLCTYVHSQCMCMHVHMYMYYVPCTMYIHVLCMYIDVLCTLYIVPCTSYLCTRYLVRGTMYEGTMYLYIVELPMYDVHMIRTYVYIVGLLCTSYSYIVHMYIIVRCAYRYVYLVLCTILVHRSSYQGAPCL